MNDDIVFIRCSLAQASVLQKGTGALTLAGVGNVASKKKSVSKTTVSDVEKPAASDVDTIVAAEKVTKSNTM